MRGKFLFGAASAAVLVGFGLSAASAQVADPPGDDTTQASVTPGSPITGALDPAGDRDWYRLRVQNGQRYQIHLDASDDGEEALDPLVAVYGADGVQLAMNDDSDGSLNSALTYTPSASGEVFVEARGFLDEAQGGYVLRVEATTAPPDDAGNDASTRALAQPGRAINGALESPGDVDWYRLNARTGQRYRISLSARDDAGESLSDPLLRVIGADGVELAMNDDSEMSLNSSLEFIPTSNGNVFIEASAFGGQATGAYALNVQAERLPPDSASSDRNTRARLAVGGQVNDSLDYPGDRDWWRIRLDAGQSYRFSLTGNLDDPNPLGDPLIRLHGADGAELAVDDDGGDGLNSYLEFTAPTTGNYFVSADAFGEGATGGYTLAARAGDIPADASTDVSLSAAGDYREGVLSPAGDKDWFRIDLEEGQAMRIAVNSAQSDDALGDPYLVLYGPDGVEVGRDDDGGEGLNSWLEHAATTGGPHYLEIRGFIEDAAQGRYEIAITGGGIGSSPDGAESITPNGEGRHSSISPAGDSDWFAIDLVEGRPYRFNLEATDGVLDPVLTLYDSEGNEIVSNDDGGVGANSYLTYVSNTGGIHFAGVSAYDNETTGAYALRVSDTDVPGNLGTDEFLADGDDRVSRIDMPGDLDNYRVELQAGVRYLIEVRGQGDNPLADPFLAVLSSSGERIISDDDSGPGLDSLLRFTPATTDQYYIQASGLGGSMGWYIVSVTRDQRR